MIDGEIDSVKLARLHKMKKEKSYLIDLPKGAVSTRGLSHSSQAELLACREGT